VNLCHKFGYGARVNDSEAKRGCVTFNRPEKWWTLDAFFDRLRQRTVTLHADLDSRAKQLTEHIDRCAGKVRGKVDDLVPKLGLSMSRCQALASRMLSERTEPQWSIT